MSARLPLPVAALLRILPFCILPLAGCGGSSSTDPPRAPLSVAAVAPDGLTASLTQDRATVTAGGSVTYTLRLTNSTAQPITYQEILGCATQGVGASLRVVDAAGNAVYPSPDASSCTVVGMSQPITLAAGQSASATVAGITLQTAGRYLATASFSVGIASATGMPTTTVGPLAVDAR